MLDYWPRPVALVASSHLCDGAPRLFHNLGQLYGVPVWIIDTPAEQTAEAEYYLARQLAELASWLAGLTGARVTEEGLRAALNYSNQARYWLLEANRWRRSEPSPLAGERALDLQWIGFMGQGSPAAVRIYRQLARELHNRVVTGRGAMPAARHRLLWLHLKPYYPVDIWRLLAEAGTVVAFEEFSHVYWPELVPEEPWPSLARKMQSHFALGPVERRLAVVKSLVRDYACDGVVCFNHWGCRQSTGAARLIKEALQTEGVPCLLLPGDCVDRRNYAPGQVHTRIGAFLELLDERRPETTPGLQR